MKLSNPNLEADTNGNSNFALDLNKQEQSKHERMGSFLIRTKRKRFDLYRLIGFACIGSMQTRKGSMNELLFLAEWNLTI